MPRTDNGRHRGVADFVWDTRPPAPPLITEYADASIVHLEGTPSGSGSPRTRTRSTTAPCGRGCPSGPRTRPRRRVTAHRIETARPLHAHRLGLQAGRGGAEMRWVQSFAMKPDAPVDDPTVEDSLNRKPASRLRSARSGSSWGRRGGRPRACLTGGLALRPGAADGMPRRRHTRALTPRGSRLTPAGDATIPWGAGPGGPRLGQWKHAHSHRQAHRPRRPLAARPEDPRVSPPRRYARRDELCRLSR